VRGIDLVLPVLVALAGPTLAQTTTEAPPVSETSPNDAAAKAEPAWSFNLSAYTYFVPHDHNYVQPSFLADRDWLHLEARYNYEAFDTGSAWVGYNFAGGEELAWEITPMLGGVFGATAGIAPGYRGSLSWWQLELYSEGEFVFDMGDSHDSFFYNWSELTLAPLDWFRFGLVAQHTSTYESDRNTQLGVLVRFTIRDLDLAAYVLNPDESKPIVVLSASLSF
jgi:hypothetical protein